MFGTDRLRLLHSHYNGRQWLDDAMIQDVGSYCVKIIVSKILVSAAKKYMPFSFLPRSGLSVDGGWRVNCIMIQMFQVMPTSVSGHNPLFNCLIYRSWNGVRSQHIVVEIKWLSILRTKLCNAFSWLKDLYSFKNWNLFLGGSIAERVPWPQCVNNLFVRAGKRERKLLWERQRIVVMLFLVDLQMIMAIWVVFARGQFGLAGIVVDCACVCVNRELVWAITHHPLKLESPNLVKRCKKTWLISLLFWRVGDLDLQGKILLKIKISLCPVSLLE